MAEVDGDLAALFRELVCGRAPWPLFVHGDPGRGKTFAALALADRAKSAVYTTLEDMCDLVMQGEPADVVARWEAIQTRDLAVLDELAARQHVGDLEYSIIKKFADRRELYAGRVAVYISNVTPEQIGTIYGGRLSSRILCGTWYELKGKDRRADR